MVHASDSAGPLIEVGGRKPGQKPRWSKKTETLSQKSLWNFDGCKMGCWPLFRGFLLLLVSGRISTKSPNQVWSEFLLSQKTWINTWDLFEALIWRDGPSLNSRLLDFWSANSMMLSYFSCRNSERSGEFGRDNSFQLLGYLMLGYPHVPVVNFRRHTHKNTTLRHGCGIESRQIFPKKIIDCWTGEPEKPGEPTTPPPWCLEDHPS